MESYLEAADQGLYFPGMKAVSLDKSGDGPYRLNGWENSIEQATEVLGRFAPRAFRRPVAKSEVEPFAQLANPAIESGREWPLRLSVRSMLSSPQFLLFGGEAGTLDDYALASRLSYFLWKSMPDNELFDIAKAGKLSDAKTLAGQEFRRVKLSADSPRGGVLT
ncbi:MAG: DUF1595 domain-containing protein [Verrucomicrobia bacterium]|nr:DUF1595 domain-containing protein [Verrucomicrobiota bacterium]